jgi:ABC-type lipoprotein release transport system permease subunit
MVIEENALLKYRDKQYIATLKGVGEGFEQQSRLDTMVAEGEFTLRKNGAEFMVMGYGVAYYLDARLNDYMHPVEVYVPSRTASPRNPMDPLFRQEVLFPSGFFAIQEDFDSKYVIVPIEFMQRLLGYQDEITSIEIKTLPGADIEAVRERVQHVMGPGFGIKDRYQQQEMLYKIMKSEKWAIFMILAFILLIATFNVIGSLSMLIIDKRRDIAVLYSMGAGRNLVRRIFLTEGLMISLIGAIAGMALGALICFLQQEFGLVRLGAPDSTFVVNTYPVAMQWPDFILVFATVMLIGYLAAWYPVHNIRKMNTSLVRLD